MTNLISPSGAWASGGIVSTPRDVGAFMRAYLRGSSSGPRRSVPRGASSGDRRCHRVPARTRPGSRCSVTAPAAARSTATPAASPDTRNGSPRPPTAGVPSRPASTYRRPRARCSTASGSADERRLRPAAGLVALVAGGPPRRPRPGYVLPSTASHGRLEVHGLRVRGRSVRLARLRQDRAVDHHAL